MANFSEAPFYVLKDLKFWNGVIHISSLDQTYAVC